MKVFFDADVLFSLMYSSNKLSAAKLLSKHPKLTQCSSEECKTEAIVALERLGHSHNIAELSRVEFSEHQQADLPFFKYVNDKEDAHVIKACVQTQSKFLVTYNIKDYKTEEIYKEFGVLVLNPGELLNYLRHHFDNF